MLIKNRRYNFRIFLRLLSYAIKYVIYSCYLFILIAEIVSCLDKEKGISHSRIDNNTFVTRQFQLNT